MPQILDPADILKKNDALNFINYKNINGEQQEFLRSDLWYFEFIVPPACVYFPGNDLIKARLTEVSIQTGGSLTPIQANIRGFEIQQNVSVHSNGSISLSFVDFEDQSISIFKRDWQQKLTNMDNKFTYRKEDTVAQCKLVQLNSSRIPIYEWVFQTCQLTDGTINRTFGSDDASNNGNVEMNLSFEHCVPQELNIDI